MAFGGGELFKDVGDVGGVHLREAILLDLETDAAGGVAVDEVDEVPWDDAGAEAGGDAVDGIFGEAFEESADSSPHAHFDLGDAEGEVGRALFTVLPYQIYVVDADDLVAMDVNDLLVEQVAFEEEVAVVFRERRGTSCFAELHGAAGRELKMGDRDESVAVSTFGRSLLDDNSVNVGRVDRGRYGKLTHVAEGASLGVDDGSAHEGRDARFVVAMLCHRLAAMLPQLYLLPAC